MDFILILLIPILLLIALFAIPLSQKGVRLRVAFILLGFPFILFFGDEIVGQSVLHTFCLVKGGYSHSNPVINDGYFDGDRKEGCGSACLAALGKWNYTM